MSVLMNFAMFPTDQGISVSAYVSKIVEMISQSGFDYRLTAMGTIVETENVTQAFAIAEMAYDILEPHSKRVYATISLDIQTNKPMGRITKKTESIEDKIGKLKT